MSCSLDDQPSPGVFGQTLRGKSFPTIRMAWKRPGLPAKLWGEHTLRVSLPAGVSSVQGGASQEYKAKGFWPQGLGVRCPLRTLSPLRVRDCRNEGGWLGRIGQQHSETYITGRNANVWSGTKVTPTHLTRRKLRGTHLENVDDGGVWEVGLWVTCIPFCYISMNYNELL